MYLVAQGDKIASRHSTEISQGYKISRMMKQITNPNWLEPGQLVFDKCISSRTWVELLGANPACEQSEP